jgi:predicted peroxiredoxin
MNRDILIVVRHGPYGGFQAAEGLRHANGALSLGFRPIVVLVDDGVYLAKTGHIKGRNWPAPGRAGQARLSFSTRGAPLP